MEKNKLEVLSNYAIHGLRRASLLPAHKENRTHYDDKEDNMKNTPETEFPGIGTHNFTSA